ncbi:MAG TPA: hypothetical protein VKG92_05830 [Flavobacteriales bacterium]|nr:hypothetical protein [Flavobacteriales bacterium]
MSTSQHTLQVPVLFIAFNRHDAASRVLEAIRQARPPRLYFACDGPRNEAERVKCEKVRSLANEVDWPCEVFTKFSEVNLGVRMGEATAMTWFWENEEMGIVLEDDTYPARSFFPYCQELLQRYKDDERIWAIMGTNLAERGPAHGEGSYQFSTHGYGAYWGWAGWRRVWRLYDVEMKDWPGLRDSGVIDGHFLSRAERNEVHKLFEHTWNGNIRSWDYQFDMGRITNHAVNIIPGVNLIRNIGFGAEGTHTTNANDRRNKEGVAEIGSPLVHPRHVMVDKAWDRDYFQRYVRPTGFRRFKNTIKNALPGGVDEALTPVLSKLQDKLGINRD